MSTLDSSFPLYTSKEIGHPWHPTALVIIILGKMHSFSSLIDEMGKWSLFELLPANLSKPFYVNIDQGTQNKNYNLPSLPPPQPYSMI